MKDLSTRRRIAEEILGVSLNRDGYAPCPGRHLHSSKNGTRDFRVILDDAPTGYCFHSSCAAAVETFNKELRRRIGIAESSENPVQSSCDFMSKVANAPRDASKSKRPPFDIERLKDFAKKCPVVATQPWLKERSPVRFSGPPGENQAIEFLEALYEEGERVLVFENFYSQGDFLFEKGKGTYRLGEKPRISAVPSPLPEGGREGIWFLVQPVCGTWKPNGRNLKTSGQPKLGRRHGDCVTAWKYAVLESDDAPEALWLEALVQLPLPIVAIYTSGGRSVHALVRVDCQSKAAFDLLRDEMIQVLSPLGADAAAITAVRLSRLPGMLRGGSRKKEGSIEQYSSPRPQELLWLNPNAPAKPIFQIVKA